LEIDICGEKLSLLAEKAIYWADQSALLISDVHLGKISHFRKSGIGLPSAASRDNYSRIARLILDHKPTQVIFLGDLFHSTYNEEWKYFVNFINGFEDVEFILILGNHDILDDNQYQTTKLQVVIQLMLGPFLLTHHPTETETAFNLCGHIHPAIRLRGASRQSVKIPCFYLTKNQCILPAFGTFTGTHILPLKDADRVYGAVDTSVIRIQ